MLDPPLPDPPLPDPPLPEPVRPALRALDIAAAAAAGSVGAWEWVAGIDEVVWDATNCRLHGLEPGEFDGTLAAWWALVHPDDRGACEAEVRRAARSGGPAVMEYRVRRPDGDECWFESRGQVLLDEAGRFLGAVGVTLDVTDRHGLAQRAASARRRLALLGRVSEDTLPALDVPGRLAALVRAVVPELADGAMVVVRRPDGRLRVRGFGRTEGSGLEACAAVVEAAEQLDRVGRAPTGANRALVTATTSLARVDPEPLDRLAPGDAALRRRLALLEGWHICSVPLLARGTVVGALSLVRPADQPWTEEERLLAEDIGRRGGIAVDNAVLLESRENALTASERARNRLEVLSRATVAVNSSLELGETLDRLVDVLVPSFADVASVWLAPSRSALALERIDPDRPTEGPDDGFELVRAAIAVAASSGLDPLPLGQLLRIPRGHPVVLAVEHGAPAAHELSDDGSSELAGSASAARSAARARAHSLLAVPLVVRGHVVGALSLLALGSRWPFDSDDVAAARELAERASLAVERASTFRQQREVAVTLQRSLLGEARSREELAVAARYVAGVEGTEVGGDWYDVVPLGAGRTAVVIGDVMGRGVRAAAVMGQLRAALRAFAQLDLPPTDVLGLLDSLVHELDLEQIITVVYAVHDPSTNELVLANAGHPPPLVLHPDGTVQRLEGRLGAPLGVQAEPFRELSVQLPAGSTLVLYTDGLIESRDQDIDVGLAALERVVAQISDGSSEQDLAGVADGILAALGRAQGHDDDTCVLLARPVVRTDLAGHSLSVPLRDPGDVATARARAVDAAAGWDVDGDVLDVLALVVSELATNAVLHAGDQAELRLRQAPSALVVEVLDASPVTPRRRASDAESESGRGVAVVAALADRWGFRPTPEGKAVWAEIALPVARSLP